MAFCLLCFGGLGSNERVSCRLSIPPNRPTDHQPPSTTTYAPGVVGGLDEALPLLVHVPHAEGLGAVPVVALVVDGHVHVDDVPVLDHLPWGVSCVVVEVGVSERERVKPSR